MHVVFAYFNSASNDVRFYENELEKSILKFYDLYRSIFELLVELRYFAENKIAQRRTKHLPTFEDLNPNDKFVKNQVLIDIESMLKDNKPDDYLPVNWSNHSEVIKHLFQNLENSRAYSYYLKQDTVSYINDKHILYLIIEHLIADNDELYNLLEDFSIYWNDDIEMALTMNIRTIQRMKSVKGGTNKLMALFKNKEDQDFVKRLFLKTIANHNINKQIINEMSLNWEPERIAKVDKIIMEIAMTEFAEFPLIPIPVSMNEYIDMAKYYSTENSHTFINGVLDNAVTIMKEKGLINKRGFGLIEKLEEVENSNEDSIDDSLENEDDEEEIIFDDIYDTILENDD